MIRRIAFASGLAVVALLVGLGLAAGGRAGTDWTSSRAHPRAASLLGGGLIEHVVIVYQENHSFDQVLGARCAQTRQCDGATSGLLPTGSVIPLQPAPDIVPGVTHSVLALSIVIPSALDSQHNGNSMLQGDNWIG